MLHTEQSAPWSLFRHCAYEPARVSSAVDAAWSCGTTQSVGSRVGLAVRRVPFHHISTNFHHHRTKALVSPNVSSQPFQPHMTAQGQLRRGYSKTTRRGRVSLSLSHPRSGTSWESSPRHPTTRRRCSCRRTCSVAGGSERLECGDRRGKKLSELGVPNVLPPQHPHNCRRRAYHRRRVPPRRLNRISQSASWSRTTHEFPEDILVGCTPNGSLPPAVPLAAAEPGVHLVC